MSNRPLKLEKWGISWEEYKELSYFCLQYDRKKREAAALLTTRISTPPPATVRKGGKEYGVFLPHGGGGVSDPVSRAAEKREKLLADVRMIEAAARYAGEDMAPYILRAVTSQDGVRKVKAATEFPCGLNQFYAMRRKFFWALREMRAGDWK